jgi:hypothetical protein
VTAMMVARIPVANAMVTTSPEVVRVLSFFMQVAGVAAELAKQRRPGAQEPMAVTVGMQLCVFPALSTKHIEVDFVVVTEHASVPVVIAAVVAVVVEAVVVLEVVLSLVVEETVVLEAEVVLSELVVLSAVVLAAALEGVVVVFAVVLAVVAALVVFAVVFAVVESASVVEAAAAASVVSALLLKSSFSSATSSWHSFANHIAPTAASDSSHPPAM